MKTTIALSTILFCAFAFAQGPAKQGDGQDGDVKMKQPKDVKVSSAPVTHAEAKKIFDKAWNSLVKSLKAKGTNPVKLAGDAKPVTKDEVLAGIKAIVTQATPMFKRSATPVNFSVTRLRKSFDQATYGKLIKDGFVMPVGPLATGTSATLTTFEFGDSVGVMLVRISDLIHLPSRKYSPALMDGN